MIDPKQHRNHGDLGAVERRGKLNISRTVERSWQVAGRGTSISRRQRRVFPRLPLFPQPALVFLATHRLPPSPRDRAAAHLTGWTPL